VSRRRRPTRVGEILPDTAASLGLADELRLARLMSTWTTIVAEHLPAAAGGSRVAGLEGRILLVEADHGLIGQEIRLREPDLVAAIRAAPGGGPIERLRVRIGGRSGDSPL
jgi:predicted nucleic acid-binding Zn ribbon protein